VVLIHQLHRGTDGRTERRHAIARPRFATVFTEIGDNLLPFLATIVNVDEPVAENGDKRRKQIFAENDDKTTYVHFRKQTALFEQIKNAP